VAGLVGLHDLCGQLARNGIGTGDGGINVKQLHEFLLDEGVVTVCGHGKIVQLLRWIDKLVILR
jgi:hypothetical protein